MPVLNQLFEKDPGNANTYWIRARLWYSEKQFEKALDDMDEAIKLTAESPRCSLYAVRAKTFESLGLFSEAIQDWQRCFALDPAFRTLSTSNLLIDNIQHHIDELTKLL